MCSIFTCCFTTEQNLIEFVPSNQYLNFNLDGKKIDCYVNSVYDGDTIKVLIPMQINIHNFKDDKTIIINNLEQPISYYEIKIRLYGIDTPEMKPLLSTPNRDEHIKKAHEAKNFLSNLILNKIITINFLQNDKYGRPLANIFYNNENINELMIKNNFAKSYDGGTKDNKF